MNHLTNDTIVALASPNGTGAIAVIRISGPEAIKIADEIFANKKLKSKNLALKTTNTIHFGVIHDREIILDEVLLSLFKSPGSYTGEDVIEISCHGSLFIQQQVIQLILKRGTRLANRGEFTLRAFLNKKMDLSQAEAVADLISSNSSASHELAMRQMRGGFSEEISLLREKLINFASLIELELDFSEEDVEFANREDLKQLILKIHSITKKLADSFAIGNVIKTGVPVAIVGKPNAGKSTLLNAILNEERAIVSAIPGTTRDSIEDEIVLGGISFRFIDTAGIRETSDEIESIGVIRTYEKIREAAIVIYLFDVTEISKDELTQALADLKSYLAPTASLIAVGNKTDQSNKDKMNAFTIEDPLVFISAKEKTNLEEVSRQLLSAVYLKNFRNESIVTNARHAEALNKTNEALEAAYNGLNNNITGDFLAMDIRRALHYLGEITGQITTDDLLGNIFSKFCIGK